MDFESVEIKKNGFESVEMKNKKTSQQFPLRGLGG